MTPEQDKAVTEWLDWVYRFVSFSVIALFVVFLIGMAVRADFLP